MSESQTGQPGRTGWKPIPVPLKVLFVVYILWMLGTVMNLPNLYTNGLPLLGTFINGIPAVAFATLLDFVGPVVFLVALWLRKSWAPVWAYAYLGIFITNTAVALLTVSDTLGLPQILVPLVVSTGFVSVVFWQRGYFTD
ncbi:MAG: hypothetical protein AAF525_19490 [Pseudomonadota bacterium]